LEGRKGKGKRKRIRKGREGRKEGTKEGKGEEGKVRRSVLLIQ